MRAPHSAFAPLSALSRLSALALAAALASAALVTPAHAQQPAAANPAAALGKKLQPYIACINRLSERSLSSRERYLSWVNEKTGPTGRERIIYGLYTIYDTKDCEAGVAKMAAEQPSARELEKAGAEYAGAVSVLYKLLEEANDYYDQGNYKDDKMAKGREMHPKLMAAYTRFAAADKALRAQVDELNDKVQVERLAAIEKAEGKSLNYFATDLMIKAKVLARAENVDPKDFNLDKVNTAITAFEAVVKEIETFNEGTSGKKISSSVVSSAKSFLTSAKELMRRVRDKTPYSQGDRMMLSSPGGGWMVSGSPARMMRDYNQLVEAYNRGVTF